MGQLLSRRTTRTSCQPIDSFNPFPNLSLELRLKIWGLSLPGPRTISVEASDCIRPIKREHCQLLPHDESDIPVALHVSRESRTVALKFYSLAFSPRIHQAVYFDFEIDALHFLDQKPWIRLWRWRSSLRPHKVLQGVGDPYD